MDATTTTSSAQAFKDKNNNNGKHEITRQEIQSAIAKAVELRALHDALMRGNSPANARFTTPSPVPPSVSHFSANDYPVFTPSYEDDQACNQNSLKSLTISETWDENGLERENSIETMVAYYKEKPSSGKGLSHSHICPSDDSISVTGSCANQITVLQTSPANDYFNCKRTNRSEDFKSISIIASEFENTRNSKSSNIVVSVTEPHSSFQSHTKSKGVISRLFPRLKRKSKNENSPSTAESEDVSQVLKDLGIMSVETLKKELVEAHENRDLALVEVSEMKSSLVEMKQKLEYLESYCGELKNALKEGMKARDSQICEQFNNLPQRGKSFHENLMPVSEEVMVEGFLQIVSESRLSVKQLCKTLINNIDETDHSLTQNLNFLLQPYKLSLNSKYSKAVLYHFEAFINRSLYQDFENCVFQMNGCPKFLDPQQDFQAQFSAFVSLRNLSWNEVLKKGTKYYSEEFSKFCDQKMSCVATSLSWTRPWSEQLLQAFIVAAKCTWLLHLLAFSFNPPLRILRVEENRNFDPHYMEDMCPRSQGPSRVKIMVMPGFYIQERVLRCKVLCRYKSAA
ncbi:hypothetical protein Lal_00029332 [Lupinus albus]|uniref:Uncharacterized protein n=1 Tax=Lupinus albus TaxID=3870 RepID=A0A6A4NVW7_LUPAL|nr:hypothetical protein Lalb_Chr19g0138211 [Lupinus albus]KAF1885443.1 hypothetical protein Lal_00029332 [Lupinus albus]